VGQRFLTWEVGAPSTTPLLAPADEVGAPVEASPSPAADTVAVVLKTQANGGGDLWVLDRASGVLRQVTATPEKESAPAWRADGRAVALEVDGAVAAVDLATHDVLVRHDRAGGLHRPRWIRGGLAWFEAHGADVDLVFTDEGALPRVLARGLTLPSHAASPVADGVFWVAPREDAGALWAVGVDGTALVVDTGLFRPGEPTLVKGPKGWLLAFTGVRQVGGPRGVHLARLERMVP